MARTPQQRSQLRRAHITLSREVRDERNNDWQVDALHFDWHELSHLKNVSALSFEKGIF